MMPNWSGHVTQMTKAVKTEFLNEKFIFILQRGRQRLEHRHPGHLRL